SVVRGVASGDAVQHSRCSLVDGRRHRRPCVAGARGADDLHERLAQRQHPRPMRPRRGMALLAALWLVVALATVALQFGIEAHQRRQFGILVSERGQQRALAIGAFALTRAKLEQALRVGPQNVNGSIGILRAADPWLDIDSLYTGMVYVDSI